eukprot:36123-Chlamydomonas_euryale.AAC.2
MIQNTRQHRRRCKVPLPTTAHSQGARARTCSSCTTPPKSTLAPDHQVHTGARSHLQQLHCEHVRRALCHGDDIAAEAAAADARDDAEGVEHLAHLGAHRHVGGDQRALALCGRKRGTGKCQLGLDCIGKCQLVFPLFGL